MSVKLNENQFIITEKFNSIFSKKNYNTQLYDPDKTLAEIKDCLSDIIGVKFIESNHWDEVQKFIGKYQLFIVSIRAS